MPPVATSTGQCRLINMKTEIDFNFPQDPLQITSFARPRTNAQGTMRANVFHGPNDIRVEEVPRPSAGIGEAVMRITLTTICGTDFIRGENRGQRASDGKLAGRVIEVLGEGFRYQLASYARRAITPCGQCRAFCRAMAQC